MKGLSVFAMSAYWREAMAELLIRELGSLRSLKCMGTGPATRGFTLLVIEDRGEHPPLMELLLPPTHPSPPPAPPLLMFSLLRSFTAAPDALWSKISANHQPLLKSEYHLGFNRLRSPSEATYIGYY